MVTVHTQTVRARAMPRQVEAERAPVPRASRPGCSVCRMQGPLTALLVNRNALKHGAYSAEALVLKRQITASLGWPETMSALK
jgi:hypothetical protein